MVKIRTRSGEEATLENGVWTSDIPALEEHLALMMIRMGPLPEDGNPEYACSLRIASALHADIVAYEPVEMEYVPGRVY